MNEQQARAISFSLSSITSNSGRTGEVHQKAYPEEKGWFMFHVDIKSVREYHRQYLLQSQFESHTTHSEMKEEEVG